MKADVVVAGAGPAGFCAAVAAARNGAEVVLAEQANYIGGLLGCLHIWGFYNYQGEQVIYGIAQELVDRLMARGGSLEHMVIPNGSLTAIDTELLKIVTQEMAEEAGVRVLFHTIAAAPIMEGNTIKGIITENKSGRQAILAKVVIDASGDGDVAARAGAPFEIKDKRDIQPGNLMFRMDNVNVDKIRLAIAQNPNNATVYPVSQVNIDYQRYLTAKDISLDGFIEALEEARRAGDIPPEYPMRWCIFQGRPRKDEVAINMAMATHFHSTDAWDLSRAEIEGRKWIPVLVKFLRKYIPGFEEAKLISSHSIMGIRESRRIIGDYVLTEEDVLGNRRFEDGVAVAPWGPSPGHNPHGRVHDPSVAKRFPREGLTGCEVPYRCLLPKGLEGLLIAGRCISTTGLSQNAIRVMAPCMSIGQAAGTAAALAVQADRTPRQLDPVKIRQTLLTQDVRLLDK
jgi:hypothetical protein